MNFIDKRKQKHNIDGYHNRHHGRSKKRADAIIRNIGDVNSILDIGCNQGLTSRFLLANTKVKQITGIEISKTTVDADLLKDNRFTLVEGNICDLSLDDCFDAIIYGAVHHHIFREHGLGEAVRVFQKIAKSCKGKLFFETGHIAEGGRWLWQKRIREYFRTDEEHIFYLLRSIEERILDFKVIGRFWIHGARRWLLCITMNDKSQLIDCGAANESLQIEFSNQGKRQTFTRTFGSKNQRLIPVVGEQNDAPAKFQKQTLGANSYFIKTALHSRTSLVQEFHIGKALSQEWAVQPFGMPSPDSILFPFIEGKSIAEYISQSLTNMERKQITDQILSIWNKSQIISLNWPKGILIPLSEKAVLSDVMDLNPNNLLVEYYKGQPRVRVIDFEPQSNHYRWKNKLHIAKLLMGSHHYRLFAIRMAIAGAFLGIMYLFKYELKSIEERIRDKQPSLSSVVTASIRTFTGRTIACLIPSLDEK